ncbi:MBL fold metallo-hydrolase [Arthrobacter sulfonylureivorans]|uniref:MBL fold metallo-hydrolase n=1 Tax=Arthrobacter sulfonylureivorans TaxID=2486855 RepID=A0ABY3WC41_9MICC|nr:MBL fold metallo-hydrolase [Arthrobacter sulfonylureivorans]UNK45857.1 MBL fold metallo-hydrolase [Arthrobacter sulfonylureivorans]
MSETALTHVGGPTALLKYGGWTFLTDPTFDEPGEFQAPSGTLVKTIRPAIRVEDLPAVDVILLSHDQHVDNLDSSGRRLVESGGARVLGTLEAAGRMTGVSGMAPWERSVLEAADRATVTVTSVPAQHGPDGCEPVVGIVTGFVLTASDLPTVYVSGDNASLDVVSAVAGRFAPIGLAVLFAGAARVGALDNAALTLTAQDAAAAARALDAAVVVPVHAEGWSHYSEGHEELRSAFAAAGLQDLLRIPTPGEKLSL